MADILIHDRRHNGAVRTYKFRLGKVDSKGNHALETGEVSDGYHTFNELYRYRLLYNALAFRALMHEPSARCHKSKLHSDGEECFGGGWFIVVAYLKGKQISNHYELKDWDLFDIPEQERADEWDGHTPQEAAERLEAYLRGQQ